jgi:hypothetical protein
VEKGKYIHSLFQAPLTFITGKSALFFRFRSNFFIFASCRKPATLHSLVLSSMAPKTGMRREFYCQLTTTPHVSSTKSILSFRRTRRGSSRWRSIIAPLVLRTASLRRTSGWKIFCKHNSRIVPRCRFSTAWSRSISTYSYFR